MSHLYASSSVCRALVFSVMQYTAAYLARPDHRVRIWTDYHSPSLRTAEHHSTIGRSSSTNERAAQREAEFGNAERGETDGTRPIGSSARHNEGNGVPPHNGNGVPPHNEGNGVPPHNTGTPPHNTGNTPTPGQK